MADLGKYRAPEEINALRTLALGVGGIALIVWAVGAYFNTTVKEITPTGVVLATAKGEVTLKNDFVLALTGYHPDLDFLRSVGIRIGGAP